MIFKELQLLIKKNTCALIEQTETKPQKTVEFRLNRHMDTFSFNPPINVSEENERFLAVTCFEATNTVLKITDENNSFSVTTPRHWSSL